MEFPIIYKETSKGQIQKWLITVEDDSFYTTEGILNGRLTISKPTKCFPKNVGKINETSGHKQAVKEAQAKFDKKLKEGYVTDISEIGKSNYVKPMLAENLKDRLDILFKHRTFISPKLDGIRALLVNGSLYSRKGNIFKSCPHLEFNAPFILDGELYNHDLHNDFEELVSIIRTEKPTKEDLEKSEKLIKFYVYDIVSDKKYSERFKEFYQWWRGLPEGVKEKIVPVPSMEVVSLEQIEEKHSHIIENNFEGSIIRLDMGEYEHKRSKQLLKYKNWKEEDFEILEILEGKGNRANMCGKILVRVNDTTSEVSPTGNHHYMESLWTNRKKLIGKKASVKFFDYTKDGKLRFPTLKTVRDYE